MVEITAEFVENSQSAVVRPKPLAGQSEFSIPARREVAVETIIEIVEYCAPLERQR